MLYYSIITNHGGLMKNDWIARQAKKYNMTEQQFLAFLIASGMV